MCSSSRVTSVSRETQERLACYEHLLRRWNQSINLVSPRSLEQFRSRHLLDSLQLLQLIPDTAETWVDLGSGGGLPALPIAIVATEKIPHLHLTLVESDRRKAVFLETVIRETGITSKVLVSRAEHLPPLHADVVSARALAELGTLVKLLYTHGHGSSIGLFPKGRSVDAELGQIEGMWKFNLETVASRTDPTGVILKIGDLSRES